jgi:hypothetical protein
MPASDRPELRRAADAQISSLCERVGSIERGNKRLEAQVAENTEMTKRIEANTAGVVEAFNAVLGGLKVLGFLARMAKWASWLAAGGGALWVLAKTGHLPTDIGPK